MWWGGDGAAPPARRAPGVAAQLPSPGVKGRGDGASSESCVLFFWGGHGERRGSGRDQPHPGHPHPDACGPVPGCNRARLQPRETLGEKLRSSGREQAAGSRAGRRWEQARLNGGVAAPARWRHPPGSPPGEPARGTCGTRSYFANAGCPGTWRVRGRFWGASVFFWSLLKG